MSEEEILDDINFCLEGEYITREHYEAIQGLMKMYKELKEYKKISELTKISCCTAQNCEALNNAIREGLENQKLRDKLEESESRLQEEINEVCKLKAELYGNSISKDKIREFALSESQADTYHFKTVSLDRLLKFLEEE